MTARAIFVAGSLLLLASFLRWRLGELREPVEDGGAWRYPDEGDDGIQPGDPWPMLLDDAAWRATHPWAGS